jgi:hypothetical protein
MGARPWQKCNQHSHKWLGYDAEVLTRQESGPAQIASPAYYGVRTEGLSVCALHLQWALGGAGENSANKAAGPKGSWKEHSRDFNV